MPRSVWAVATAANTGAAPTRSRSGPAASSARKPLANTNEYETVIVPARTGAGMRIVITPNSGGTRIPLPRPESASAATATAGDGPAASSQSGAACSAHASAPRRSGSCASTIRNATIPPSIAPPPHAPRSRPASVASRPYSVNASTGTAAFIAMNAAWLRNCANVSGRSTASRRRRARPSPRRGTASPAPPAGAAGRGRTNTRDEHERDGERRRVDEHHERRARRREQHAPDRRADEVRQAARGLEQRVHPCHAGRLLAEQLGHDRRLRPEVRARRDPAHERERDEDGRTTARRPRAAAGSRPSRAPTARRRRASSGAPRGASRSAR